MAGADQGRSVSALRVLDPDTPEATFSRMLLRDRRSRLGSDNLRDWRKAERYGCKRYPSPFPPAEATSAVSTLMSSADVAEASTSVDTPSKRTDTGLSRHDTMRNDSVVNKQTSSLSALQASPQPDPRADALRRQAQMSGPEIAGGLEGDSDMKRDQTSSYTSFHSRFTRKLWLFYCAACLRIAPSCYNARYRNRLFTAAAILCAQRIRTYLPSQHAPLHNTGLNR